MSCCVSCYFKVQNKMIHCSKFLIFLTKLLQGYTPFCWKCMAFVKNSISNTKFDTVLNCLQHLLVLVRNWWFDTKTANLVWYQTVNITEYRKKESCLVQQNMMLHQLICCLYPVHDKNQNKISRFQTSSIISCFVHTN